VVEGAGRPERRTLVRDVLWNWQTAFNAENAENAEDGGIGERQNPVFERIGGYLGLAFYAAQAVALGGGLIAFALAGDGAGRAWLRWTLPPMIGLGMAAVYGMTAVGAAMALWKVFREG